MFMHLKTVNLHTYSNMLICEYECKSTEMLIGWQPIHQYWFDLCWQMDYCIFSVRIPLPFSNPKPCPGQKLDRHSTIKPNEECVFNEEGGGVMVGGRLNQLLQICYTCRHADTQIWTHERKQTGTHSTAKHFNLCLKCTQHKI